MLSTIARLWDINGYCAPVILYVKLLIKSLWIAKIGWDEQPPSEICSAWKRFIDEMHCFKDFKIPRFIGIDSESCRVIIVGFSDASTRAYGAVVYTCVEVPGESNRVNLICAKSKIAPLKVVSLARLELCAILILSKLMTFVSETIASRFKISNVYTFTDSAVALHWVHSSPHRFDTFVANRISKIQENLDPKRLFHIDGKDNPSDCLSRGLSPAQIIDHPLWMHGPSWMHDSADTWPTDRFSFKDELDEEVLEYSKSAKVLLYSLMKSY